MSKRLIVGDLHFGVNETDESFLEYQRKSLEWIIDYIEEQQIDCVDFLGDVFHNRSSISHKALELFNWFFKEIENRIGVIIVGNHDSHYKNTNKLNSIKLVGSRFERVDNHYLETDNQIYVPWICKDNNDDILNTLKNSKKNYCLGHFKLSGFEMQKGILSRHETISLSLLEKFDLVISGHYHTYSKKDNIVYLGTPYEMNFSDCGVDKFVGVFEKGNLDLVKNELTYFITIMVTKQDHEFNYEFLSNKKIKLFVNCERNIELESNIQKLKDVNKNVEVIDNFTIMKHFSTDSNVELKTKNVVDMWEDYVNEMSEIDNKEEVTSIFLEEYNKATLG